MDLEDRIFSTLGKKRGNIINFRLVNKKNAGYFFLKQNDFYNYVKMRLKSLENCYRELLEDENYTFKPLGYVSQKYFYVYGMINVVDSNNIFLYSNINGNNDISLKLNLEHLERYSLFSGQVAAIKGKNLGNNEFIVESIQCIPTIELNSESSIGNCTIRIISGDISDIDTSDIDVLILIGVDIFKHKEKLENWVKSNKTNKVILVPVLGDNYSINVFPQVMYEGISPYFISATNPVEFFINGKFIVVNTLDILLELKKEEVTFCKSKSEISLQSKDGDPCGGILFKGDRIDRLCYHILFQQSYLPLWLTSINVQYDSEALAMRTCPDIYILKSKIESFKKQIGPAKVINIGNDKITDIEIKNDTVI